VLLTSDGTLYTFGSNEFGQLGLGDTRARTAPARVELAKDITTVACGGT
jgi:alpha-tubulin suppressor-like RCC1 family protein